MISPSAMILAWVSSYGDLFFKNSYFLVVHMKEDGYKIISEQDCTELHYKYAEEKK